MKAFRRVLTMLPFVLIQVAIIVLIFTLLEPIAPIITVILMIFTIFIVLFIATRRMEGSYKIIWLIFVAVLPIPGTICYLCFGNRSTVKKIMENILNAKSKLPALPKKKLPEIPCKTPYDERLKSSLNYVEKRADFPTEVCEDVQYYPLGEVFWEAMLEEMKKAEKFIYLEFFIVMDGKMWGAMCDIMAEKIKAGVDVRFIYDDLGSLGTFSTSDTKKLDAMGMKYFAFNRIRFLTGSINNRTHRKMMIIDGKTAFSGGNNLSDEYINVTHPHGHWKDIGFKITGPAVKNYLHMFMQFWNAYSKDQIPASVLDTCPKTPVKQNGYVLSYYDSPAYTEPVSNNFILEMLGNATKYAWFYTPYLILSDSIQDALVRAAQRGVDVRIIMPGIPDKKLVFTMSRSYY
ncbi:MAG: PLDc N-terminal domain-containing protein, partial [Eubacterium sp.]|nr:PLDc N-terminal domain-containing protein [Eubacterium sp.]